MENLAHKPRKQNRALLVLLMPVIVVLWFIGWSFQWTSYMNQKNKPHKKKMT